MTLNDEEKTQVMLGTWTVRDIVVHVGAWLREMTGALELMARGERPRLAGTDYGNGDTRNARFVEESKGKSPGRVEAEMHAAMEAFVRGLRALPEERLAEGKTARRIVNVDGTGHFKEHSDHIREWKSRTGAGRPIAAGAAREASG
jgi:hypothetical protein